MLYNNNIRYETILREYKQELWFARFTDHPKYTIEHEIDELSIDRLVIKPKIVYIVGINYDEYENIDIEIRVDNYSVHVIYNPTLENKELYSIYDNGIIIGSTYSEVINSMESQLIQLIDEYHEWNDRVRFRWYVECLRQINDEKYDEYINKYPEMFI